MRALVVGALVTLTLTLAVTPAYGAARPTACLPDYVTTGPTAPCGAVSQYDAAPTSDLLGGLVGDGVRGALSEMVSWADRGAAGALRLTASLIGATTAPALTSTWFSAAYWRVAALSTLLTVPFLFAACIHALVRADLGLLTQAAFGYLPLAMVAVAIAAPLTTLLLAGTDEMCTFVSAASHHADSDFLGRAALALTSASVADTDPFVAFFAALLTVIATLTLWLELLIRGAAVEVIVFMLPLFFAAMVWPARRVWAIRAIETLVALILSKFAIVAVLTLGGAAITHATAGPSSLLTGAAIVLLTVFTAWALLRLLPLHEVAAAAAGGLSGPPRDALRWARDRALNAPGRGDGAGSEDGDAALRRMLAGHAALIAMHGGGATEDDGEPLSPRTNAGLQAVGSAGSRRTSAAQAATGDAVDVPSVREDRPPLSAPFDGKPWPGYTLGGIGDDAREAPRIVSTDDPDSAAGEPPPVDPPPGDDDPPLAPPPLESPEA